ncbi:MAG: hypothetical protein JNL72_09000 [Flavipsychrobacter sp.]|nr:hypothetical protein [Flavipsychrobacter sp.]
MSKQQAEVTLSDGRIALIKAGKGRDAKEALRISGGREDEYMNALMSRTVSIDGKPVVPEELDELPMNDYIKIQTEFSEINF